MATTYWKMVAENIARGLGPKAVGKLSSSGKFLTRAGSVIGVGFMAYELFKNYKDNIESEPAYQEMVILQHELEKWGSAVSCIGRKPITENQYGSLDEGGAINALRKKRMIDSAQLKPGDPEEASTLIERAIGYIEQTENVFDDKDFIEKRTELIERLKRINNNIMINSGKDYTPIQRELAELVVALKPIESAYSSRIYDCSQVIQKKVGSNAAWAALSMVTLGIVKKPKD